MLRAYTGVNERFNYPMTHTTMRSSNATSLRDVAGFTLIELLVVIAIIGILASVVLASLNSARAKGADAAVKANLNNLRAQAELFYDDNTNVYTGLCADANIDQGMDAADAANGSGSVDCDADADEWAAEAQLVANTAQYYCVDSTGAAQTTTSSKGGSAYSCP